MLPIPIIVLAVVFVLIAVRQIGRFRLQIWQIMLLGAVAVLAAGQISPGSLKAIDWDVILFLFGHVRRRSGHGRKRLPGIPVIEAFRQGALTQFLLFLIVFGIGILAALMMNDTLAIIGTPIMIQIAAKAGILPKISFSVRSLFR